MANNVFDPFSGTSKYLKMFMDINKGMDKRRKKKHLVALLAQRSYMPSTIADCHKAINNDDPWESVLAMLSADTEAQTRKAQQEEFIKNPPKVHGNARFDNAQDLKDSGQQLLYNYASMPEKPDAIYLGGLSENTPQGAFPKSALHWSGESHLITIAPTRTGKAISQIIPNLLRYKGSVVVVDPKGELFKATSKWRSENVGPVYLLNPFDIHGLKGITHAINPMDDVKNNMDADDLAEILAPPDKGKDDFFDNEVKSFLGAAILFFAQNMPPEERTLASLRDHLAGLRSGQSAWLLKDMSRPDLDPMIVNRMSSFKAKDMQRSIPRLSDSLDGVLKLFDNSGIREATSRSDFSFEDLKENPATVYITIPLRQLKTNGRYVTMLMDKALNAMLDNPHKPTIPVLFVLDEFLALPPSETVVDALRTHASAGARLWFFLQDKAALEKLYPNSWQSFMQAEVECYFGTDDHFTAKMISEFLGTNTKVVLAGNASGTTGGGAHYSYNEAPQVVSSDLMSTDEVQRFLAYPPSHIVHQKSRNAIYRLRGATLQGKISPYPLDPLAASRFGSMLKEEKE